MLTKDEIEAARMQAVRYFAAAGIVLTEKEKQEIEIADFGLGDLYRIGLEVLVYINTERVCAKELVMFPGQTCPEHIHPTINGVPGKEETFRCRWGKVHLYVDGTIVGNKYIDGLGEHAAFLRCAKEIVLMPGDQYTIMPDTNHWFRAGEEGAVVSEFSTRSTDELDRFTDPEINRFTVILD